MWEVICNWCTLHSLFHNSGLFSLIFRALLNIWKNWLIFSLPSRYGSCIYTCHEVWMSKITTTNQLHGAEAFLGKLLVSELVKKVPAPNKTVSLPKILEYATTLLREPQISWTVLVSSFLRSQKQVFVTVPWHCSVGCRPLHMSGQEFCRWSRSCSWGSCEWWVQIPLYWNILLLHLGELCVSVWWPLLGLLFGQSFVRS